MFKFWVISHKNNYTLGKQSLEASGLLTSRLISATVVSGKGVGRLSCECHRIGVAWCWIPALPLGHYVTQEHLVVQYPLVNVGDARDAGSIAGSGRSPGGGNGNPLQYSCRKNPMDRGAWRATAHGAWKSWTRLSNRTHLSTQQLYSSVSGIHSMK